MCGLAGCLGVFEAGAAARNASAMADQIAHRGPDDRGCWQDEASGLALVHNRLSIIDLSSAGHQPMSTPDGRFTILHNGEVVNFKELREELGVRSEEWRSGTDTEVLLRAYEKRGPACVRKLAGMFVFVIWDAEKRELFLARDAMGIKPLYYCLGPRGAGDMGNAGFYFASELKALLAIPGLQPVPNRRSIARFMEFNFIPDPLETGLEGVFKLPPGHSMTVSINADRSINVGGPKSFFSPPLAEPLTGGGEEIDQRSDRLFGLLSKVVEQHLIADVPVALLLSGGLDSSIIAALASRGGRLRTLTMAFDESKVDERPFARIVAQHIGSEHEEIVIRPSELIDGFDESIWFVDDLFGDWGVLSTRLLYRKAREAGFKVVLVGEGSDELFGGYSQFGFSGALRLYQGYSGRRWGRGLFEFMGTMRSLRREAGDDFSAVRLFETRHQLPNCYEMKVDKASMSESVEARVPYLDRRVAEEAFRTPREALLRSGTNKYLLRHMAERHGLLPTEITRRDKFGASIAASWLDDNPTFRSFAREVVLEENGWARFLGLERSMRAYFDRGRSGYAFPHPLSIFAIVAWRLLMLNLWSKHYLRTRAPA